MEKTKSPERTCAVCRKKASKQSFIRIVKMPDANIVVDKSYKINGRGMYVCNALECINKCIKNKAINRVFKVNRNLDNLEQELNFIYEHSKN